MKVLNPGYENDVDSGGSSYWNRTDETCYLGVSGNATTSCSFTNTGLTSVAKSKIEEVKWYLGGWNTSLSSTAVFHAKERGTSVFNSADYPRETSWVGHVGLMYPSDYGYTYSLGVDEICDNNLNNCRTDQGGIPTNGWLHSSFQQWTLSSFSTYSTYVFLLNPSGYVSYSYAYFANGVRPVVYLKSNIQLSSGSGSISDPFQIS